MKGTRIYGISNIRILQISAWDVILVNETPGMLHWSGINLEMGGYRELQYKNWSFELHDKEFELRYKLEFKLRYECGVLEFWSSKVQYGYGYPAPTWHVWDTWGPGLKGMKDGNWMGVLESHKYPKIVLGYFQQMALSSVITWLQHDCVTLCSNTCDTLLSVLSEPSERKHAQFSIRHTKIYFHLM